MLKEASLKWYHGLHNSAVNAPAIALKRLMHFCALGVGSTVAVSRQEVNASCSQLRNL